VKINGHCFDEIESAFEKLHANHGSGKPTAILMSTTKGKGVSFMEDQAGWHGKAPNDEQYAQGMAELEAVRKEIEEA
jgi:transketolase